MTLTKSVLVLIADGSEEIETVTVVDILRRAQLKVTLALARQQGVSTDLTALCSRGVKITADISLQELIHSAPFNGNYSLLAKEFVCLVLPGGLKGAEFFRDNDMVQQLIKAFHNTETALIAAICAAPIALARAGVIAHTRITSYPSFKESIISTDSSIAYVNDVDVVVDKDNRVLTSRGPATAFAFSMAIVQYLSGDNVHASVAEAALFKL